MLTGDAYWDAGKDADGDADGDGDGDTDRDADRSAQLRYTHVLAPHMPREEAPKLSSI